MNKFTEIRRLLNSLVDQSSKIGRRNLVAQATQLLHDLETTLPPQTSEEALYRARCNAATFAIEVLRKARHDSEATFACAQSSVASNVLNGVALYGQQLCSRAESEIWSKLLEEMPRAKVPSDG